MRFSRNHFRAMLENNNSATVSRGFFEKAAQPPFQPPLAAIRGLHLNHDVDIVLSTPSLRAIEPNKAAFIYIRPAASMP